MYRNCLKGVRRNQMNKTFYFCQIGATQHCWNMFYISPTFTSTNHHLHQETILPKDAFLPVPPGEFSGVKRGNDGNSGLPQQECAILNGFVCIYTSILYIYIYTHTYIYICIYTYIYTHVYTYLYLYMCVWPAMRDLWMRIL